MPTKYHAEHVGSLLRPPELVELRAARSPLDPRDDRQRELEDQAVLDALELQRQAGIEVFTDGEMRRDSWMAGLLETVDGVVPAPSIADGVSWHYEGGGDAPSTETHMEGAAVAEKVRRKLDLTSIEAEFMARHAPGPYKITMVSASMGAMLWDEGISGKAYASPVQLIDDLATLQAEEIEGLVDQGVDWIQIDSLAYVAVIDEVLRNADEGPSAEMLVDLAINVDNRLVRAAKAKDEDVTVAMHFCRGNNRSAWIGKGGYEWIAERVFAETEFDRYLLEYDTERAGGFEPLRFFPKGKTVVLGIVSSKTPELESQDALMRRVEEASKYVAIEDLAISPQCGFASTLRGNLLSVDDERRKLELVVQTAREVWA